VEKDELKRRLLQDPLPAILDAEHPEESFEQMYIARLPIYEKISNYSIETEDQLIELIYSLKNGSFPS
jgi:shikimate kinase